MNLGFSPLLGAQLKETSVVLPEPSPIATPIPFWKTKSDIYKKMTDDRYIAVSAKSDNEESEKKLSVTSAGVIHAPREFTNSIVMKFSDYPKFVPYIEEASFDQTTRNLFIHGAVLGFHERMTLHMRFEERPGENLIFWQSIGGGFVGMNGIIDEKQIDADHTEISMFGGYKGKELGLPSVILNWGLEFAAHRASGSMRSHIESEWEYAKKH